MGAYLLVGRFVYKQRTKLRTTYGLTNERVLVQIGTRALREAPVHDLETAINRSRDGSHVSLTFGPQSAYGRRYQPNSGMDIFSPGSSPLAFFDVADPEQLLAALETAHRG